jgi:hypothetical protein
LPKRNHEPNNLRDCFPNNLADSVAECFTNNLLKHLPIKSPRRKSDLPAWNSGK